MYERARAYIYIKILVKVDSCKCDQYFVLHNTNEADYSFSFQRVGLLKHNPKRAA